MSIRLDRFYFDGEHTAIVYGNVTGEIMYQHAVKELRSLSEPFSTGYADGAPTSLRTVVKSYVSEEPYF